ncbi:hypothetical protein AAGG74_15455 [Bacillus mexicanus]|uniref:hypothetical protein n=1 Tax=Bacillus mexicanus TaxID=2834415 RepID=UPI003D25CD48
MLLSTIFKWISGIGEAILGIPFLGGLYIIANGWTPLFVMFVVHLITLFFSLKDRKKVSGSILGIFTSLIGWIPVLGMIMHLITATFLILDAYVNVKERSSK